MEPVKIGVADLQVGLAIVESAERGEVLAL